MGAVRRRPWSFVCHVVTSSRCKRDSENARQGWASSVEPREVETEDGRQPYEREVRAVAVGNGSLVASLVYIYQLWKSGSGLERLFLIYEVSERQCG
jgi:hypothetical protein